MNPRILKETRALLPICILTVPLVLLPPAIWGQQSLGFSLFLYFFACALMAAVVFGAEYQNRTFAMLLTQPVPRVKLWREKMLSLLLMGGAMTVIVFIATFVGGLRSYTSREAGWWENEPDAIPMLAAMGLVLFCVFCTLPLFTFFSKSTIGALVFSILIPMVLLFLCITAFPYLPQLKLSLWLRTLAGWCHCEKDPEAAFYGVLIFLYSLAGYGWGRSKFLHLEITDSRALELEVPGFLQRWADKFTPSPKGPTAQLVIKELQLQRLSVLAGLLFCGLVLLEFLAKAMNPKMDEAYLAVTMVVFALIVPVIIGAIAVAEERSMSLAGWHLTLPPSALRQWLVKVAVALLLSLVVGLVLPGLAYFMNPWRQAPIKASEFWSFIVIFIPGQLLVTALVIYAASLADNTIKAIIWTLGVFAAFGCWWALLQNDGLIHATMQIIYTAPVLLLDSILPAGLLIYFTPLCLGACVLGILFLGFLNFRRVDLRFGRLWRQWLALMGLLTFSNMLFNALMLLIHQQLILAR